MGSFRRTLSMPAPQSGDHSVIHEETPATVSQALLSKSLSSNNSDHNPLLIGSLFPRSFSTLYYTFYKAQTSVLGLLPKRSSSGRNFERQKSSKSGNIWWRRAFFHFLIWFLLGIFIGFTPFASPEFSIKFLTQHQEFAYDKLQPVEKLLKRSKPNYHHGSIHLASPLLLLNNNNDSSLIDHQETSLNYNALLFDKLLIVVTPIYGRSFEAYYVNRLANTLRLVPPPLLWIVVEMTSQSLDIAELLRNSGVMFRHLVCEENLVVDLNVDRSMHLRNVVLAHVETHKLNGIIFFANYDNIYSTDLFDQMRQIRRFGTWKVGQVEKEETNAIVEGPVCNGSKVIGWHTNEIPNKFKRFHSGVSGFAFNSTILWDPKRWNKPILKPVRFLHTVKEVFQLPFIPSLSPMFNACLDYYYCPKGVVFAKSSTSSSTAESGVEPAELRRTETKEAAVNPVYKPTPSNRPLRTPHSGYHFDGSPRQFFEGWYFKVSIPECRQSFCFMYSVENPAFTKRLNTLEVLQYGTKFTGVGAQILGADDKYICQFTEDSSNFWGSRHELMLGNTFTAQKNMRAPNKEVHPQEFNRRVEEGFQVTPLWHQGYICDDGRTNYADTVKTARWEYSTQPIYGWGNVDSKQKSTAGWLAAFPVFEPHWQICMAGGLSTGWIEWDGERFEFENAPSYSEKNWGGGFPKKWFWIQCNVFEGASGEVALTAAGGLRQLPGLSEIYENAALVGIHFGGVFYEFVPWTGVVSWEIAQWGRWFISAENEKYKVELVATTTEPGTTLRAPTVEAGLAPACKDTCTAELRLQLWERRSDGSKGNIILDVTSNMAAVEVGGGPWFTPWKGKTNTPEIVSRALTLPVDLEGFLDSVPLLKPPGL
ncbi:OLC1v1029023C1 [Oldenlandia corymbosa var. corymbosa]|uniref:Glycosyltransferases n=1 Tax=Oldenlandia corymbosa var. corymbosa TaxID=529605 RepID=A0AAV1CEH0_OLDCO|nr:OLC1v1029023C1 [Oldenlandia corymbosa var. corymbosa]